MSKILIYALGLSFVVGAVSVGLFAEDTAKKPAAAPSAVAANPADQQAIEALRARFIEAYNNGKADDIAATFADDSRITDQEGTTVDGRKAIADRYTDTFKNNPGDKILLRSTSLKFLSPDVALEEGEAIVVDADKVNDAKATAPGSGTAYTTLYVKRDGRWQQSTVRELVPAAGAQPSPHERLADLKWMIGDWMEEGPDTFSTSACEWDPSGNFIVWRYTVHSKDANAGAGTTFIGWDPLTRQITSWVFDSEGGHGEATWSKIDDDQWMVKASGILADGRTASATQYVKRLGPDRTSWTSVDRVAGGEPIPSISEYVLSRRPPQASGAKTPDKK